MSERAFVLYSNFKDRKSVDFSINTLHLFYSIYQLKMIAPEYDIILYSVDYRNTYLERYNIIDFNEKLKTLGVATILDTFCRYPENIYLDRVLIPFNDYIRSNYNYIISLDCDLEFFNKRAILDRFFNLDINCFSGVHYKNNKDMNCISAILNVMNVKNINNNMTVYDVDYFVNDYYDQCKFFNVSNYGLNNEEYVYGRMYYDKELSVDIKDVYGFIHHYYNDKGNDRKLNYINNIILKNTSFINYLKTINLDDTVEFYRKSI